MWQTIVSWRKGSCLSGRVNTASLVSSLAPGFLMHKLGRWGAGGDFSRSGAAWAGRPRPYLDPTQFCQEMFFCLKHLWGKALETENHRIPCTGTLGLLPALTFLSSGNAYRQVSSSCLRVGSRCGSHWEMVTCRTEATDDRVHRATWFQPDAAAGIVTLLDSILFKFIQFWISYILQKQTNQKNIMCRPRLGPALYKQTPWRGTVTTEHPQPQAPQLTEDWIWVQCLFLEDNGKPSAVDPSMAFFLHFLLPKKGA